MLKELGIRAKAAEPMVALLGCIEKNRGLRAAAAALVQSMAEILDANEMDLLRAKENGMRAALLDRLRLSEERVKGMAEGLLQVADLEDPIGEGVGMKLRPNGLRIGQRRVPLGVIGIIYEARPNVTADAFGLCFKSGNVCILKGGSDAIYSNQKIVEVIREALKKEGLPEDALLLITDTKRETTLELMRMNSYVDVLIPRGSAGLIQSVLENSKIGRAHV